MRRFAFAVLLSVTGLAAPLAAQTRVPAELKPDLEQPIDADATAKIRKYTTAPEFNSPLTDYLPASTTVPSPSAVLGDVAGAPGILPYTADVHRYFRMLAAASPRVRVISIGMSEEGRERIAVAVSSEANLERQKENDARLAQLADPRLLKLDDARAESLITSSVPVYYITGTIHSPETGAPTALMELAYRLAVDESPYIRAIRDNVITLITPVVEVDGRDRMVDVYRWHLAHPKATPPLPVVLGPLRRARQQPRRDGADALALPAGARHLSRLARPGAARPARVGAVPLRQHGGRRPLQRLGRSPPHQRVAAVRVDERGADDQVRDAGRLHPRRFRHLEPGLPDVPRGDAQRRLAALRDLRQRRRRHRDARARSGRNVPHLVSPGPAVPDRLLVAAQQQQLSADRPPGLAGVRGGEPRAAAAELLGEEQAFDRKAASARGRRRTSCPPTTGGRAPRPSCCGSCSCSTSRSRAPTGRSR